MSIPTTLATLPLFDNQQIDYAVDQLTGVLCEQGWAVADGLLPPSLVELLRSELLAERETGAFRPAAIGRGAQRQVDQRIRSDELCWLDSSSPLPGWSAYRQFLNLYQLMLNRSLFLCIDHFEGHFACYPPGSHYAAHYDRFAGSEERVVTVILYLNDEWSEEAGGALRIYPDAGDRAQFNEVLPLGGRIVSFISEGCLHEVRPAVRERYSLTGWFRIRTESPLAI